MKIIYLDCYKGITGGAFAPAIMDACSNKQEILSLPEKLHLTEISIKPDIISEGDIISSVISFSGNKKNVVTNSGYLNNLLWNSELETAIKEKIHHILKRIVDEFSAVFNMPEEEAELQNIIPLREFVEIAIICKALNLMQIEKIYVGDIILPCGTEAGKIPRIAVRMLKNRKIKAGNNSGCYINMTGAAVMAELAENSSEKIPGYILTSTGYGAQINEEEKVLSAVRVLAGEIKSEETHTHSLVIEFNVDDMNPQQIPYLIERLLENGAADVFITPIIMKKGRPGFLVTVTCSSVKEEQVVNVIFSESSTIGVKKRKTEGIKLKRDVYTAATSYGKIKVKEVALPDGSKRIMPEYDECAAIAKKENLPLRIIQERIISELNQDKTIPGIFNN
jgi:uncharacterized protein (DUF111 family)